MKQNNRKHRLLALTAALAALCLTLVSCTEAPAGDQVSGEEPSSQQEASQPEESSEQAEAPAPSAPAASAARKDSDAVNAAYLKAYYGIELEDTVTQGDFFAAAEQIGPYGKLSDGEEDPLNRDEAAALTAQDAVRFAVYGAMMEDLALTYSDEKIAAALAGLDVDEGNAPFAACALDLGMIAPDQLAAPGEPADKALVNALLMEVAGRTDSARNYMGYSDDPDLCAKLLNLWNGLELFDDDKLSVIGGEAVMQQLTTGYNLKHSGNDARFLPELTLRYGHSDIVHALQIVGLLQSEGIVARVQMEPKVSIYQYLPEWGEPGEPTSTYMVKEVSDDLMLAYAVEYDLSLEFASQEDKKTFDGLIVDYAKKNTGEEGKSLLYGSWWQPLYVSPVEMGEEYHMIYDNVISNGEYSLHPFCLEENKDEVLAGFQAIDSSVSIEQVPIWCNAAFYRYLNGESE